MLNHRQLDFDGNEDAREMADCKKARGASGLEVSVESKNKQDIDVNELNEQELMARQGKQICYVWEAARLGKGIFT